MLKFRCFHAPFFMPDLNIGHFLFTPLTNNIINRNMNRLFFRIYITVFEPTLKKADFLHDEKVVEVISFNKRFRFIPRENLIPR